MQDDERHDLAEDTQLPTSLPEENEMSEPSYDEETQDSEATGDLSVQASEKTRQQFEKLKEHNRKLKEQLDQLSQSGKKKPSLVDELYPQIQPQQPFNNQPAVNQVASSLVDENGYVDMQVLNNKLESLNLQAQQAREEAMQARQQVERYEHNKETREAYKEYPQLDPDDASFDPAFYDLVKKHIVGQMYESGKGSILEASRAIGKLAGVGAKKAEAQEATQKNILQREVATQSVAKAGRSPQVQLDELRSRSVKGDLDAIAERLRASGY
jgi:hypothetical protein